MMQLSVIIPCYNGAETIAAQLEALARQQWSGQWEVIVADNGSTDASMEIVKAYKNRLPDLRIVDASKRKGQPYALNTGAGAARGESVAFCDADDEVGDGWVRAMGEALKRHDFVASRIDITKLNPSWLTRSRRNPQERDVQQYRYPPFLPHAGGGTIGVKKTVFEAVGGFDETFPLLHDTDFCWKVQIMGVPLVFVPDAVMHVRFRDSFEGIFRQARGYGEFNVKIYKRYLSRGMPRISLRGIIRSWMHILRQVFTIRDRAHLGNFIWQVGYRLGRLKGSLMYRVFAL